MTPPAGPFPNLNDLVDDLVSWWHCYGAPEGGTLASREPWEVTNEQLPLGLDDAARLFVDHMYSVVVGQIRQAHEQAWRDLSATLPAPSDPTELQAVVVEARVWAADAQRRRPVRRWPVNSPEPVVPKGFTVRRPRDTDQRDIRYVFNGSYSWRCEGNDPRVPSHFYGQSFTWRHINHQDPGNPFQGSTLEEVIPSGPRRWEKDSPEPDMPAGFKVRTPGSSSTFIRRTDVGAHRWTDINDVGFRWDTINHIHTLIEVIE